MHKNTGNESSQPPVSVIICAKNELKNLELNLPAVLDQNYPEFQVVVVDDGSWDGTDEYLEQIALKYKQLKIVTLKEQEKYRHGKKFALSLGIKASVHEVLIFTDADCRPLSDKWITEIVKGYSPGKEIVLGYGSYQKTPGFVNKLIRYDTFFTAIQYLSYALAGNPYMGVGRNLSYKRQLFFNNKGFASHSHIMSGDDDLFVNETSTGSNTAVVLAPDSFTVSIPKNSLGSWLKQKKRHLTTGFHYKGGHKLLLSSYQITQFLFYGALTVLLIMNYDFRLPLAFYLIRLCCQMAVFGLGMKKLEEKGLLLLTPLFDIVFMFIYPSLAIANIVRKEKTWK